MHPLHTQGLTRTNNEHNRTIMPRTSTKKIHRREETRNDRKAVARIFIATLDNKQQANATIYNKNNAQRSPAEPSLAWPSVAQRMKVKTQP